MYDFSPYARNYLAKMMGSDYRSAITKILYIFNDNNFDTNVRDYQVVADGKFTDTKYALSFCNNFFETNVQSFDMSLEVIEEKPKQKLKIIIRNYLSSVDTNAIASINLEILNGVITKSTIECDNNHRKKLIEYLIKN